MRSCALSRRSVATSDSLASEFWTLGLCSRMRATDREQRKNGSNNDRAGAMVDVNSWLNRHAVLKCGRSPFHGRDQGIWASVRPCQAASRRAKFAQVRPEIFQPRTGR